MPQIKNFDNVSYKFKLFDAKNQPVNGLNIVLQFFNSTSQVWEDFFRGIINNGTFLLEEATAPLNQTNSDYLDENYVPQLRIVTAAPYYNYTKKQVLSAVSQLTLNATASRLTFDFGTSYLVEKATLDTYDTFSDFILITSRVSLFSLQSELNATRATLAATQATLASTQATLASTQAELTSTQTTLASTQAELTSTQTTLTSTQAELTSTQAALATCNATIQQLTAELNAKTQEIAALTLEIAAKNETIATLNTQLISALSDVQERELEIARLEALKLNLETTITQLQLQIAELSREINFDDRPVAINTLYSNFISEIDASAMNNRNANYKLTNISLKLKALVSSDEDGINAQLFGLSNSNLVNDETVSELTFDIAPLVTAPVQGGKLPNLLGLTETAVRRILDSLGLRLNPVFQNNQNIVNGDSFRQSPAEGGAYNSNDSITVIFSKHE